MPHDFPFLPDGRKGKFSVYVVEKWWGLILNNNASIRCNHPLTILDGNENWTRGVAFALGIAGESTG